ncbi:transposase [Holospora elegans]|uniref:transposase n=1 Tax=Holospora elegans TaxID=431043 RepID=UPI003570F3CD
MLIRGLIIPAILPRQKRQNENIILHYLPPYSLNLTLIERLLKVMNKKVRNNHCFSWANEFQQEITNFFSKTWLQICDTMMDRAMIIFNA